VERVGVVFFVFVRVDVDRFCVAEGCAFRGPRKTAFFRFVVVVAICYCCFLVSSVPI
jgi:hypothetical protein